MENNTIEIQETKAPFIQEHKVGTKLCFGEHELEVLYSKNLHCTDCFSLALYMIVEIFAVQQVNVMTERILFSKK